jgi:hypothetical protein
MSDANQNPHSNAIRIVGVNTDKTRRTLGSDTQYHVYFSLSRAPTRLWRSLFLNQWKALTTAPGKPGPETSIDGEFLSIDCPLKDVGSRYLPELKKAVAATNISHAKGVQEEEKAQQSRENVWKDERTSVDEMAASLHFE